jgi:serine/threonine protein kinase/Tol biopolymer transport system component
MLSHYRLVEKIGEGGMGVVWKALDTKLDREVAIKVLPEAFGDDAERLARFEREAKLLASLNHPNIATIHGFLEAESTRFLAMELVGGEGLEGRLERGPVPRPEALEIARQIAEALEAAHEHGVVHRDLKPANVRLTADGRVKVLDFGLAKALIPDRLAESPDLTQSPTITSAGTTAGVLLGTAAYMSPEQIRGRPADRRVDIWAFGVVLYELLTGRRLFKGETPSDILAAVLREEPDLDRVPAGTSPRVRRLLRRCLERDPSRRLQAIGEARIILEDERSGAPDPDALPLAEHAASPVPRHHSWLPWAIAVAAVAAAIVLGVIGLDRSTGQDRVVSHLLPPPGWVFNMIDGPPIFSPDGRRLAFLATSAEGRTHLFLRALDRTESRLLDGTEGAQTPFWSPDGNRLAFFADGKLMKIDLHGGSPEVLADARHPYGGSWSKNGTVLFAAELPPAFYVVDERGGPTRILPHPHDGGWDVLWPQFLPDGRRFLFSAIDLQRSEGGIYVGSLDEPESPHRLLPVISKASYVEPGWLLFWQEGGVRALTFDIETLELGEEPEWLANGVGFAQYLLYGRFAVARNGLLAYQPGSGRIGDTELALVDRAGRDLSVVGSRAEYYAPRLSHDGRRAAVDITEITETESPFGDIWILDLRRNTRTRLTRDPANASSPVWTADDSSVIFRVKYDLYVRDASAVMEQRLLFGSDELKDPRDVSPSGRHLLFTRQDDDEDLWVLDLESGEVSPWIETDYAETGARFSPDGHWVAYQSDESGLVEVYLQSFPEARERIVVSTEGGCNPAWRADGGELYYLSTSGEVVAVAITWESGRPRLGESQSLFRMRPRRYRPHGHFDVCPDGETFLLNRLVTEEENQPLVLIQNWATESSEP